MNYETFKSSAVTSIQKYFGDNTTVSLHSIMKNNNIRLDGLTIQNPTINISPTIYLNYYYDDYVGGKSFPSIVDDIITAYQEHLPRENMDLSFFTDYNKVKYHIIYKLIHFEQNQELLKDVPHFRFLDLAIVFCCFIPNTPNGNATILIHNHHLSFWDVTAEALYELAKKNTPILLPYELKSMEEVLNSMCSGMAELLHDSPEDSEELPKMYVLTNKLKLYGASCMLYPNVLADFAKSKASDLYIIPSSIHEILLIPKEKHTNLSDLNHIIQEVNTSQVLEEEVLSDHAYYFDRATGLVSL